MLSKREKGLERTLSGKKTNSCFDSDKGKHSKYQAGSLSDTLVTLKSSDNFANFFQIHICRLQFRRTKRHKCYSMLSWSTLKIVLDDLLLM